MRLAKRRLDAPSKTVHDRVEKKSSLKPKAQACPYVSFYVNSSSLRSRDLCDGLRSVRLSIQDECNARKSKPIHS